MSRAATVPSRYVADEARPTPAAAGRRRPWRLVAAAGLVVLAAATLWGWVALRAATTAVAFRTAPLARGDLDVTISATGTIEPEDLVDVGAQVAGMIREFGRDPRDPSRRVDYGSAVEAGTVLARIDDTLYRAQLDQARANMRRATADLLQLRATLRKTERSWARAQSLRRTGVVSEADYDVAEADYDAARSALGVGEASVAQAEAALRQAKINVGYTTIRSPVRGVVVDRRVNIGQTVVASLNAPSLFLIAKDLTRLEVWASVNEADIGRIRPGQAVAFTVDAFPGETFAGSVEQVRLNATMTQNVVTYTVVVTAANPDGRLLPYLTANLKFQIDRRRDVLLAPNAALRFQPRPEQVLPRDRDAASVAPSPDRGWLWVADGRLVRPVPVAIGASDGLVTEIVRGDLRAGDAVVIGESVASGAADQASPFAPRLFGGGARR